MKIAIIGAGAMGSTVGGHLSRTGAEIYFVDPFQEHVDAINEKGLIYEVNGTEYTAKIKAYTSADQLGEKMDAMIFLVKGLYTKGAALGAKCLAYERTVILTVQNGMGNVEILSEVFGGDKIMSGLIEFGGKMVEPGHVSALISPTSRVMIGAANRKITPEMKEFAEYFVKAGFQFSLEADIAPLLWYKMTKNCSGNPVCGIVRLPLGPYHAAEEGGDIADKVADEVRSVAAAMGIQVPPEPVKKGGQKGISPESPMYNHLPSTAQDMYRKKKTEIDFLNGAVVRYGEKYQVPTPYNRLITDLVKIIENNYDNQF